MSARRLVLDVGGGALGALLISLWRPAGWPALLGAALCLVAFGAWAVAERRLTGPRPSGTLFLSNEPPDGWPSAGPALWRAFRAAATLLGTVAAVLVVFGFLFGVLGTWIS